MFGSKRGVKGDQNFLYQPFDIKKLGLFWTVQEPGGFIQIEPWSLEAHPVLFHQDSRDHVVNRRGTWKTACESKD